jgi:hypothetical protein
MKTKRHIGGSLLPSTPAVTRVGTPVGLLQVRALPEWDTHGLFLGEELLASHPNGFSCLVLAERIRDSDRARQQADYIVACGGKVTEAGRKLVGG